MKWLQTAFVLALICACASARSPGPSAEPPRVNTGLLDRDRIRSVAREPGRWLDYLEASRRQRAADSAFMVSELATAGLSTMTQGPYARSFEITSSMTPAWFATDSAGVIADNILSFQAPNGGWSKHVSYTTGPRKPGQSWFGESSAWNWISTFDNSTTTEQLQFLALRDSVRPDKRYQDAYIRGLRFIRAAQFPNGCWPQVWPLDGGYHDAATFNDDATTNVLTILERAASGRPAFLPSVERELAGASMRRGIECVLDAQLRVNGTLTAWGQQHDPLTLAPTSARSYELVSLTAQESANLMRFLIRQPSPSPRLAEAIHAAAAWLESATLRGYTYDFQTGRAEVPGAGPIWARMYEIGTNRPIFSDRNGVKLYDWNELKDRRTGYAWYTYAPVLALRQYERWARRNPRSTSSGSAE